jgi:hypothetical protein
MFLLSLCCVIIISLIECLLFDLPVCFVSGLLLMPVVIKEAGCKPLSAVSSLKSIGNLIVSLCLQEKSRLKFSQIF